MPQTSDTALLILDFQVGIGDQPYAKSAAQRAAAALKAGRAAGLPVVFSKVNFRAGYRDIADSNKAFALIKMKNLFPPDAKQTDLDPAARTRLDCCGQGQVLRLQRQ